MGTGDSPFLPYIERKKSACSVFVGIPVLGPALWIFRTTNGNSEMTANPMASPFRHIPGPEDAVTERFPVNEAPIAEPTPAISSSAWNVLTP